MYWSAESHESFASAMEAVFARCSTRSSPNPVRCLSGGVLVLFVTSEVFKQRILFATLLRRGLAPVVLLIAAVDLRRSHGSSIQSPLIFLIQLRTQAQHILGRTNRRRLEF
jgi:hypothetical protein